MTYKGKWSFFVISSQSLSKLKVEEFYANQNKITWPNEGMIFFIISTPFRKENPKLFSCGELVWNDPIGLLDHKCKAWHLCYLWAMCYFQCVQLYFVGNSAPFRRPPNWWVRIISIQKLCTFDDCIYHRLIWICTNNKGSYTLCWHELNCLKL